MLAQQVPSLVQFCNEQSCTCNEVCSVRLQIYFVSTVLVCLRLLDSRSVVCRSAVVAQSCLQMISEAAPGSCAVPRKSARIEVRSSIEVKLDCGHNGSFTAPRQALADSLLHNWQLILKAHLHGLQFFGRRQKWPECHCCLACTWSLADREDT